MCTTPSPPKIPAAAATPKPIYYGDAASAKPKTDLTVRRSAKSTSTTDLAIPSASSPSNIASLGITKKK